MKKITPSLEVNFEAFGKAASLPGLLLARDVIDEQIRILRGEIDEPETKASPPEDATISLAGLTGRALKNARRHNIRIYGRRAWKKKMAAKGHKSSARESGAASWAGMNSEERSREMKRRIKMRAQERKHAARVESGRRGAAAAWENMTNAERKAKMAAMQAARIASQKRLNGAA